MTERTTTIARRLRRDATEVERMLWSHLRNSQVEDAKFRRQMPIAGYVADFACVAAKLIVEVDGGHHSVERDADRTRTIEAAGYLVLRFWNNELLENIDGVLEAIAAAIRNARPAG